jgi:hypothetical protein
MAASLAFTAGGILLCYLLNRVEFEGGKTLNASLWELLTRGWTVRGMPLGPSIVGITLVSEGALLFVAAQTGFVDGPRTLAAMAVDEWVPKRFKHLSERLVTQDGVLAMGLARGDRSRIHARRRRHPRGHVFDQRVPHVHAQPIRHGATLGPSPPARSSLAPTVARQRRRSGRNGDDSRHHIHAEVPGRRLDHARRNTRAGRDVCRGTEPLPSRSPSSDLTG